MRNFARLQHVAVLLIAAFACLLVSTAARAADAKVEFTANFAPADARLGESLVLELHAKIPEGYHLYSFTKVADGPLRLRVKLEDPGLEAQGEWYAPTPHVEIDPNFKKAVEYYEGEVIHRRGFKLTDGQVGTKGIPFVVRGQICNPKQCISIKEKLSAKLTVAAGEARAERTAVLALEGEPFPQDRPEPKVAGATDRGHGGAPPMGEGLWGFLAIAFLAGLGALVTPCVFPMIPITVSFFSKFAKVSIQRSVTMASIYAGSIVATFTLLGVIISLIFGAVGMQALSSSVTFNVFLFLLLVVFAFNLFGLFEIQVPSWLISRSAQKEQDLSSDDGSLGRQALGVFFMAITFTLVSFTCTVGFIGVVLAEAAKGNWFYPALGMLSFSLAFSLPFFFLAVFPSWADKLKGKGGDWMVAVKVVLGFVELAGAFKFLSNVDLVLQWELVTRPFVLACWVGIFLCAGFYLLRFFNLPHSDESRTVGPIRMSFAVMLISLAVFSSTGIRDHKSMGGWIDGWLPPAIYPGQEGAVATAGGVAEHLAWLKDDIPGGMAKARGENKPVFVDFTGYTCTNCRYMEMSMFPRAEIRSKLEQMVLVTAYTDCEEQVCDDQRQMQVQRYDTAALPFYAIMNPHDDTIIDTFASSTNDPKEYDAWLAGALAKWAAVKPADAAPTEVQSAAASKKPSGPAIALAQTGTAVELTFPDIKTGAQFKLSTLREQWVFVNFWASWCGPCKHELKNDFPKSMPKAPHIKLVTVAFDGEETKATSIKFIGEVPLMATSINLLGGEDIMEAGLDAAFEASENLPASYLIHPKGHIAWKQLGSVSHELLDRLFLSTIQPHP
ncbi:MAG: thioredoxin family protein [Nannocystaceae bacterium]